MAFLFVSEETAVRDNLAEAHFLNQQRQILSKYSLVLMGSCDRSQTCFFQNVRYWLCIPTAVTGPRTLASARRSWSRSCPTSDNPCQRPLVATSPLSSHFLDARVCVCLSLTWQSGGTRHPRCRDVKRRPEPRSGPARLYRWLTGMNSEGLLSGSRCAGAPPSHPLICQCLWNTDNQRAEWTREC